MSEEQPQNSDNVIKKAMQRCGDIAWEHGVEGCQVLYCVRSWRIFPVQRTTEERHVRVSEWFGDLHEALECLDHRKKEDPGAKLTEFISSDALHAALDQVVKSNRKV